MINEDDSMDAVRLTPRQLQIIRMLYAGEQPKVIAKNLKLSLYTIWSHISRANLRIGGNKYNLIYLVDKMGILETPAQKHKRAERGC